MSDIHPRLKNMLATLLLGFQVLLSPCTIPDVTAPVVCGTHRVWENRATKHGRQIDLSVIVLKALKPDGDPDPLFFLQGGPGDAPSFNAKFYSRVFANVRQTRDLVLVDLRGTGKSGALLCPDFAKPDSEGVLSSDILDPLGVRLCSERLERRVDLRQYTTEIAVDDLDEVRQALGYKQINLYSTSYGTRVAQVYMRRYPSSLRTVTLKGVVPASMASPANHATAAADAWQLLKERCANDAACSKAFPDLQASFNKLLRRLKSNPIVTLSKPANGATKIRLTPGLFAEAFRFNLYSPEQIASAPEMIRNLSTASLERIAETTLATRMIFSGERLAAGFFLSVSCTEDIPYLPKSAAAQASKTFSGDYRLRQQTNACVVWPHGAVSKQHREPTVSDIPTLLISGEFDPVTPSSGGEEVRRTLSRGLHVVVKNNGHPIGNAEQCISTMMGDLIRSGDTKELDTTCAANVPPVPFRTP